jgi:hypothetical protein
MSPQSKWLLSSTNAGKDVREKESLCIVNYAPNMEISTEVHQNLKNRATTPSSYTTPGKTSKGIKIHTQ